jgi:hypothetical protein
MRFADFLEHLLSTSTALSGREGAWYAIRCCIAALPFLQCWRIIGSFARTNHECQQSGRFEESSGCMVAGYQDAENGEREAARVSGKALGAEAPDPGQGASTAVQESGFNAVLGRHKGKMLNPIWWWKFPRDPFEEAPDKEYCTHNCYHHHVLVPIPPSPPAPHTHAHAQTRSMHEQTRWKDVHGLLNRPNNIVASPGTAWNASSLGVHQRPLSHPQPNTWLGQLINLQSYQSQLRLLQAEYDIELQRNKYYSQKKEVVVDVLVGRAARVAALMGAAKNEAAHLAGVRDNLEGIAQRSAAMNAATQLR